MSPRETSRNPKQQTKYETLLADLRKTYGDNIPCMLCTPQTERTIVAEYGTMSLVANDFPYEYFDGQHVISHNMIVPKRHISTMKDFTPEEVLDYWQIISEANLEGRATLTRSAVDRESSIPQHLHTHLLLYKERRQSTRKKLIG